METNTLLSLKKAVQRRPEIIKLITNSKTKDEGMLLLHRQSGLTQTFLYANEIEVIRIMGGNKILR